MYTRQGKFVYPAASKQTGGKHQSTYSISPIALRALKRQALRILPIANLNSQAAK
jgi:hypothetical protein